MSERGRRGQSQEEQLQQHRDRETERRTAPPTQTQPDQTQQPASLKPRITTSNPSGSTVVDLIHGPAADLLWLAVNNFPSYIAIEPLLSFLKDMFCVAGLGSTTSKSNLIDGDHEEGTLSGSSKGKEPICSSNGKAPVYDIREGALQPCSSKGKEPICDNMERIQGLCSSHRNEPICDK